MNSNLIPPLNRTDADSIQAFRSFTRFTTFFEQSIFPMQIFSLDGSPVVVNHAWEKLFSSPFNIFETPLPAAIEQASQGESLEVPAFWYGDCWFEAWVSPIKDEAHKIYEVAIILKDVTQKIETQKALVKSISDRKATDEKFQLLSGRLNMAVRAGNIGIWEWIPDTSHVFFDETIEEMFGYQVHEFPGTSEAFDQLLHPDDRDHFWATVSHALIEKKSYRIELRVFKLDGSMRWLQASGMALYDEYDKPYHMVGTVMDITDRIESEADHKFLSQATELLNGSLDHKEILKTISEHAVSYFCDGVFVDQLLIEGEIKRLMVIHKKPEVVKKFMAMDQKFPNRYDDNPVMNTLITGKPLFIEDADVFWKTSKFQLDAEYIREIDSLGVKSSIRTRLKGRESILGMMTFFVSKDSPKVLSRRHIWLADELSYRASMAVENALIHQASQEAIRSRDEFLSIASHELKTPLQSLTLQNQMRKRNLDKKLHDAFVPDKLTHMIDADLRHLMRINRLIDDMLDISRIRAGKLTFMKEQVEYCAYVKDVVERFRPQLEAVGCYMTVAYCEPILTNIDIYRTEQVIVNLLTNAMKYGAGKPIKIEILNKQNRIQLLVHDKGPGIREQDQERIFERFERAISSNEVSGLGLGLYISRQIMEQNNGSLTVRSALGLGSSFVMELPCDN
jgi:PAS domain S-box-containing protein